MVALNVKSRPVPSLLSSSLKCRCTSHLYNGVVDLAMSTLTKLLIQTFIYGNIDTNIVIDLRQKRGKECPNWQNSMRKTEKSKFGDIWTTLAIVHTSILFFHNVCLLSICISSVQWVWILRSTLVALVRLSSTIVGSNLGWHRLYCPPPCRQWASSIQWLWILQRHSGETPSKNMQVKVGL